MGYSMGIMAVLGCLLVAAAAHAQPENDRCVNATPVGEGLHSFSTLSATYDAGEIAPDSCDFATNDVWFKYTPTSTGISTVTTCAFAVVNVVTVCGGSANVLTCGGFSGSGNTLAVSVTTGVPVYIRVSDYFGEPIVEDTLTIAGSVAPPSNDACASATAISFAGLYPLHLAAATSDGVPSCFPGTSDVWFDYNPPSTGVVQIGVQNECANAFSVYVSVFDVECAGDEVACQAVSNSMSLSLGVTAGHHLRICVGAPLNEYGGKYVDAANLVIGTPQLPPDNDECSGATPVFDGFVSIDTSAATLSTLPSCQGESGGDVWFTYTPFLSGVAEIKTCESIGSLSDTVLAAYEYSESTCLGAEVACNDNYCVAFSRLVVPVSEGTPLLIRAAGGPGQAGTAIMQISYLGEEPTNGTCIQATEVFAGETGFDTTSAVTTSPSSCGFGESVVSGELWYRYTAPTAGTATFRTNQEGGCHVLALYLACEAEPFACTDCFSESPVPVLLSAGETVYMRVTDAFGGELGAGAGVLVVSDPGCAADFNGVNGVTVQDIFDFLTAWLAGHTSADFNGVNGVTVQDIFDFLTAWLAGC